MSRAVAIRIHNGNRRRSHGRSGGPRDPRRTKTNCESCVADAARGSRLRLLRESRIRAVRIVGGHRVSGFPANGRPGTDAFGRSGSSTRETGRTRDLSEGRRNRAAVWIPDHQLDDRHLGRGAGADRIRARRHPQHEPGSVRRSEPARVAGRGVVWRSSKASSAPHLVKRTFWFFGTHLHLHSCRQLVRPDPRRRHDRVGTSDPRTASWSRSRCCAAPTPIST